MIHLLARFRGCSRVWLFPMMAWIMALSAVAGETGPAPTPVMAGDAAWTQRVVETYQDLQTQQKQTRTAIEQARQEAATASELARRNAEEVAQRLQGLETTLATQRARDLAALEQSHRFSLTIIGLIAGPALIGLLVLAAFLIRAINRRNASAVPMGAKPVTAIGASDPPLLPLNPAEQSSARFLGAVERLEQRIAAMETDAGADTSPGLSLVPAPLRDDKAQRAALLIGKGQTLLNMDKATEALTAFDQAIATDPDQAEAFVKKGKALEKLDRWEEAVEQYDRAIAADPSLTIAYLYKGGVLNRLERFAEALACYEQALTPPDHSRITSINAG